MSLQNTTSCCIKSVDTSEANDDVLSTNIVKDDFWDESLISKASKNSFRDCITLGLSSLIASSKAIPRCLGKIVKFSSEACINILCITEQGASLAGILGLAPKVIRLNIVGHSSKCFESCVPAYSITPC